MSYQGKRQSRIDEAEIVTIRGTVERIFRSYENFSAGRIKTEGGTFSFVVKDAVPPNVGVELEGEWVTHERYGRQFKARSWCRDNAAMDVDGLAKYLAAREEFAGIGPARARRIAEMYAANFERALCDSPDEFAARTKVPIESVRALRDTWLADRMVNRASADLVALGLSPGKARKILQRHGPSAISRTRENPWWLLHKISGIGFRTVDEIAKKLGTPNDHPDRVRAGVEFAAEEIEQRDGHTWSTFDDLAAAAKKLLELDRIDADDLVAAAINAMADANECGRKIPPLTVFRAGESFDNALCVSRTATRDAEIYVADWFGKNARPNEDCLFDWLTSAVADGDDRTSSLNEQQLLAVQRAFSYRVSVITGGAGVGKTYTLGAIRKIAADENLRMLFCAPTGKAARRMEESIGGTAMTIHRLLRPVPAAEFEKMRKQNLERNGFDADEDEEDNGGMTFMFRVPTLEQLEADIIVVDEASMMDAQIWRSLLRGVPEGCSLIIVGDHHQLPPVGPGSTLRDLIAGRYGPKLPVTHLTQVVRQAGDLKRCVSAVLDGRIEKTTPAQRDGDKIWPWAVVSTLADAAAVGHYIEKLWRDQLPMFSFLPPGESHPRAIVPEIDVQILTPTHKGGAGTIALNRAIQRVVQLRDRGIEVPPAKFPDQPPEPMVGDRVIWTKNDYELGLMNGTMGYVQNVHDDRSLSVIFEGVVDDEGNRVATTVPESKRDRITLAWAISIHKSQGAEFPITINVVSKSHSYQLHRGLVYTSVSRARCAAVIVGDTYGFQLSMEPRSDARRTMMSAMA